MCLNISHPEKWKRCATALARLRPRTVVYPHLTDAALRARAGVARVEGVEPLPLGDLAALHELLGRDAVTVTPVLDPAAQAPVDAYEIPQRMRTALQLLHPYEVFPWGTLVVNVTGCFIIGLFAVLTGNHGRIAVAPEVRQFFMVGICGGYTTFSSFSLQTLALARDGDTTRAGLNVALSVLLCLIGVWLGWSIGGAINQIKGA